MMPIIAERKGNSRTSRLFWDSLPSALRHAARSGSRQRRAAQPSALRPHTDEPSRASPLLVADANLFCADYRSKYRDLTHYAEALRNGLPIRVLRTNGDA